MTLPPILTKEFLHVPVYAWGAGGIALVVGLWYYSRQKGKTGAGGNIPGAGSSAGGGTGSGGGSFGGGAGSPPLPYPVSNTTITPNPMPSTLGGPSSLVKPSPIATLTPTSGVAGLSAAVQAALQNASLGTGPPAIVSTPQGISSQWTVQPQLAPTGGPLPLVGFTGPRKKGTAPPMNLNPLQSNNPSTWALPTQTGAAFLPTLGASPPGSPGGAYAPATAPSGGSPGGYWPGAINTSPGPFIPPPSVTPGAAGVGPPSS